MRTDPVVTAWAEALFAVAQAEDAVERLDADLRSAVQTVAGHRKLKDTLADQGLAPAQKGALVIEVFGDVLAPTVVGALVALAQAGKHALLPRLAEAFESVSEKARNVAIADVTTAVALEGAQKEKLARRLETVAGKKVVLREHVDEAILGGVVVAMSGRVMDGSVKTRLAKMRERLAGARGEA